MNYQTRRRLMTAEMDMPEFAPHRTVPVAAADNARTNARVSAAEAAFAKAMAASRQDTGSPMREFRLQELTMLSITPILRSIHHWWLERAERHYLICADVEEQRAREAQLNVAYYQKRAALARSARLY
jgi:Spy/CpxP family protein refolding chaperone